MAPLHREAILHAAVGLNNALQGNALFNDRVGFPAAHVRVYHRQVIAPEVLGGFENVSGNAHALYVGLEFRVAEEEHDIAVCEVAAECLNELLLRVFIETPEPLKEEGSEEFQNPFWLARGLVSACLNLALDLGQEVLGRDREVVLGERDWASDFKHAPDHVDIQGECAVEPDAALRINL